MLTPSQISFADFLFTKSKLNTQQIAELLSVGLETPITEAEVYNARASRDRIIDLQARQVR